MSLNNFYIYLRKKFLCLKYLLYSTEVSWIYIGNNIRLEYSSEHVCRLQNKLSELYLSMATYLFTGSWLPGGRENNSCLYMWIKCTTLFYESEGWLPLKCDYWADSLIDGQTDARHIPDKVIIKRRRMKLCHPRKTRFFDWIHLHISPNNWALYCLLCRFKRPFSAGLNVNGCCSTVQLLK